MKTRRDRGEMVPLAPVPRLLAGECSLSEKKPRKKCGQNKLSKFSYCNIFLLGNRKAN